MISYIIKHITINFTRCMLTFIGIIAEDKLKINLCDIYLIFYLYYLLFIIYFIKIKTNLLQIRNIFFSSALSCYFGLYEFILPFLK